MTNIDRVRVGARYSGCKNFSARIEQCPENGRTSLWRQFFFITRLKRPILLVSDLCEDPVSDCGVYFSPLVGLARSIRDVSEWVRLVVATRHRMILVLTNCFAHWSRPISWNWSSFQMMVEPYRYRFLATQQIAYRLPQKSCGICLRRSGIARFIFVGGLI